jgi:hypothetical protein
MGCGGGIDVNELASEAFVREFRGPEGMAG